ncbi:MAG: M14 family metallopeptidase [Bacteroidia bacterium]|nr:M14 family metallopeptidase [Bacteroidia bacterium]
MNRFLFCLLALLTVSCGPTLKETDYDPAGATETQDRPISYEVKRTFRMDKGRVSFSNEYSGARLSAVEQTGPDAYTLTILPENEPINKSAWYGFQVWGTSPRQLKLTLSYPGYKHRYVPKLSTDGSQWSPVAASDLVLDTTTFSLTFPVSITEKPLWVSAQERFPSDSVYAWEERIGREHEGVKLCLGYSHLGKPINLTNFGNLGSSNWIVVMGRQHPPEVTGYLATQAFMETVLGESELAKSFREKFRIVMIPMLNPDGIDLGHWRQSGGGVDLNRDWANFHQPETRAVRDYLINTVAEGISVDVAIDFHSTDSDMYYVFTDDMQTHRQGFTSLWLNRIRAIIPGYEPDTEATDMASPSAKYFFFNELRTEFITYEVGDETPREEVTQRAEAAAIAMMELMQ